jgi:hypothetical protein
MSRRSKKRSRTKAAEESRAVEILTIGWLLTVITALACEAGSLGASLAANLFDAGDGIKILAGFLLFAAVIIGFISLLIAPVVLKSRKTPTPRVVIVVAVCAGVLPMLTIFWQLAQGQ